MPTIPLGGDDAEKLQARKVLLYGASTSLTTGPGSRWTERLGYDAEKSCQWIRQEHRIG